MKKDYKVYSMFDVPDHDAYDFSDENSPVVQYFRDEADINNIVHLWSNGAIPAPSRVPPRYVDCTQVEDFQYALDVLCEAEDILDSMSPAQRSRFHDDPVTFVEYFSDPAHEKEYEALMSRSNLKSPRESTSSLSEPNFEQNKEPSERSE